MITSDVFFTHITYTLKVRRLLVSTDLQLLIGLADTGRLLT